MAATATVASVSSGVSFQLAVSTGSQAGSLRHRRADSGLAQRLVGRKCFGGLDLASRLDTAAFALCFPPRVAGAESSKPQQTGDSAGASKTQPQPPGDQCYAFLCWHWLPEATANERRDKVPYLTWRDQGWITLTDGNVCDYARIEHDILQLKQLYKIVEVGFDPWNAEGPTQNLERKGIKRVEIQQTVAKLTYASKEFEKLIVAGDLVHDGNPVLDWQISNVDVYTDTSGNIKPKRPEHGDFRTIDGVAACIMALDRALRAPRIGTGSMVIY